MLHFRLFYVRFISAVEHDPLAWYGGLAIAFVHFILATYGIDIVHISNYQQIIYPSQFPGTFFQEIFYQHGSPPGLSLLFYGCSKLGSGDPYGPLMILLTLCHTTSLILFYYTCKNWRLKIPLVFHLLVFFNPLLFVYFAYPFYSTFLFFSSICLLFLFSLRWQPSFAILSLILTIFSLNAIFRSSWHIAFVIVIAVLLLAKAKLPYYKWSALLILLLPLSVYIKNYVLYKNFTASTWLGVNLSRTQLPWSASKSGTLASKPALDSLGSYKGFYNERDTRIAQYRNVPHLNRGNWEDIRMIVLSEAYFKEVKKYGYFGWSTNSFVNGLFFTMRSPASYFLLQQSMGGFLLDSKPIFNYDWLSPKPLSIHTIFFFTIPDQYPPGFHKASDYLGLINLYCILYVIVFIIFGRYFIRMPFEWRMQYFLLFFFIGLYAVVDFWEGNRMRMEVEPFFYFFLAVLISRLKTAKWIWEQSSFEDPIAVANVNL